MRTWLRTGSFMEYLTHRGIPRLSSLLPAIRDCAAAKGTTSIVRTESPPSADLRGANGTSSFRCSAAGEPLFRVGELALLQINVGSEDARAREHLRPYLRAIDSSTVFNFSVKRLDEDSNG